LTLGPVFKRLNEGSCDTR